MEVINDLDEESRERLRKKESQVYRRRRNVPQAPPNDPKLPQQGLLFHQQVDVLLVALFKITMT